MAHSASVLSWEEKEDLVTVISCFSHHLVGLLESTLLGAALEDDSEISISPKCSSLLFFFSILLLGAYNTVVLNPALVTSGFLDSLRWWFKPTKLFMAGCLHL